MRILGRLVIATYLTQSFVFAVEGQRPTTDLQSCARFTSVTLRSMPPQWLEALYHESSVASVPRGWVDGRLLTWSGTDLAPVASSAGRLIWQGKRFHDDATAVNQFFHAPIIRGQVAVDTSWFDGRPALILDYQRTSRLYRRYRDEIRQVAPGLWLGLMYDRTVCPPRLVRMFSLEQQ